MQDDAEAQKLIPLFYDESGGKGVFGEHFERKYQLLNAKDFEAQFRFIQEHVKIDVDNFIKNALERIPLLSRTHKTIDKK